MRPKVGQASGGSRRTAADDLHADDGEAFRARSALCLWIGASEHHLAPWTSVVASTQSVSVIAMKTHAGFHILAPASSVIREVAKQLLGPRLHIWSTCGS
jgi:hypothetical protein